MRPDKKRHFPEEGEEEEKERRSTLGIVSVRKSDDETSPTEVISRVGVVVTFVGRHQSRVNPNLRIHRDLNHTAVH